jgi:carbonic anhydrase/acetyltransferase-like protein (isoleucine patch superfamily)
MIYAFDDQTPKMGQGVWVADTARVIGRVILGDQASVWFGAVLRGDNEPIHIGARTNVQDNAVLHSDWDYPLTVGDDCTIGHGAIVHGCTLGNGVLVGMGAIILNGAKIGDGSLIGAGALVTEGKEIPPGSLVVGSPAKVIRELDAAARAKLLLSAENYAKNAARFAQGLRPVDR